MPATKMSGSGAGAPKSAGEPCHAQDPVAQPSPELVPVDQTPLERAVEREPPPVREDAVDDLPDHVPLLAERRHDRRDRREVGRDLEPADPAADDQRGAVAERLGARVVERVQDLAGERVHTWGRAGRRKRPDATTTASNGSPSTVQPARTSRTGESSRIRGVTPNRVGVGPEVRVHLRRCGVHRVVGRGREVGERGHRAARVRVHPGPDAAVRPRGVPLPAEVVARLEDRHLEPRLERVLRGDEAARPRADHGHARVGRNCTQRGYSVLGEGRRRPNGGASSADLLWC